MLVFDQLKKDDPQLRLLAAVVFAGLLMLLAGLWWMQVVKANDYQSHLETQSFRTVRIPAIRGKILDRNGQVLAENRPSYNVSLYLKTCAGHSTMPTPTKPPAIVHSANASSRSRKIN